MSNYHSGSALNAATTSSFNFKVRQMNHQLQVETGAKIKPDNLKVNDISQCVTAKKHNKSDEVTPYSERTEMEDAAIKYSPDVPNRSNNVGEVLEYLNNEDD